MTSILKWLQTDTLTDQDIRTALAIGAFTATEDQIVLCDVTLEQIAGDGEYFVYVSRQIGGVGTTPVIMDKTIFNAEAGQTEISGQSSFITVRSGDILTVSVIGLVDDLEAVDTIVRWFMLDQPAIVLPNGSITKNTFDLSTAFPLEKEDVGDTEVARTGADGDTLKTLSDQIDGSGGSTLTAAEIWSYATRTLTQSAAAVQAIMATSGAMLIVRGDTLVAALTGLATNVGYASIDFTIKRSKADTDDEALIRIRKNASGVDDGLLTVNGEDASDPTEGSITVVSTTALTITLAAEITADLDPGTYYYDIQYISDTGVVFTATAGSATITEDVTRAIS